MSHFAENDTTSHAAMSRTHNLLNRSLEVEHPRRLVASGDFEGSLVEYVKLAEEAVVGSVVGILVKLWRDG
jgi:hypothetical protein